MDRTVKYLKKLIRNSICLLLAFFTYFSLFDGSWLLNAEGEETGTEPEVIEAADETVVDGSTVERWQATTDNDTQNLGRIWTDKTVTDNTLTFSNTDKQGNPITESKNSEEDFLVSLSLLSSYANIKGTVTYNQPLDIVMVLDTSGSMDDSFSHEISYINAGFSNDDLYSTLKKKDNGKYYYYDESENQYFHLSIQKVGWWDSKFTISYQKNGKEIILVNRQSDNSLNSLPGNEDLASHIYEQKIGLGESKIASLKKATKAFVKGMQEVNNNISDESQKDRLSIIKFADEEIDKTIGNSDKVDITIPGFPFPEGMQKTQVVSDFETDSGKLISLIDGLYAYDATAADKGLELAKAVLDGNTKNNNYPQLMGSRPDAKKVIIFFTDGEPNHGNGFSTDVANAAIINAKAIKESGADIYSIGVFKNANPSDTTKDFNKYMHGVSSNYPNAIAYTNLGDRKPNSDYYKAATDADELNKIFDSIQQEVTNNSASYPTEQQDGYDPNKSGYVTFTDTLGDYMQISDFHSIVIGNQKYEEHSVTDNQDGTVTYSFTGKGAGNDLDTNHRADLKDILITVQKNVSNGTPNDIKGDVVEIKVPASMIPLRGYNVEVVDGKATTTITHESPMRLVYGIKPVASIKDILTSPDEGMKEYIQKNRNEDGTINFYANAFEATPEGGVEADVRAEFIPSTHNSFYYFTSDTPLYMDSKCESPLTGQVDPNTDYFYKNTYYAEGSGLDPLVESLAVYGNDIKDFVIKNDQGQVVVKAGTPNHTTLTRYEMAKGDDPTVDGNITKTARYVTKPLWNNGENNSHYVTVLLGNNGRIQKSTPGSTIILRGQKILSGRKLTPNDYFQFKVSLNAKWAEENPNLVSNVEINNDIVEVSGKNISNIETFEFAPIIIKNGGKYKFDIQETIPENADPAIDYDTHITTVEINVKHINEGFEISMPSYDNTTACLKEDQVRQDSAVFRNFISSSFTFIKYGSNNGTDGKDAPLAGAQFAIYELNCNDMSHDHSKKVQVTWKDNQVVDTPEDCWRYVQTVESDVSGNVAFDKLHIDSSYRLVEVKQPDGYLAPSGQWNIRYDANQMQFLPGESVGNPPAFKEVRNPDGSISYQVKNYKWYDIPTAGNTGITRFLIAGAGLMFIGVLWMLVKQHNRKNEMTSNE